MFWAWNMQAGQCQWKLNLCLRCWLVWHLLWKLGTVIFIGSFKYVQKQL